MSLDSKKCPFFAPLKHTILMSTLYVYNPTCDMAIENGTYSYMPPKALSVFENEITPLMAFLGDEHDYVLGNRQTTAHFKDFWQQLGINLPQFVSLQQLSQLKISAVQPWGWSQLVERQIEKLSLQVNTKPHFESLNDYKLFFSRLTSVKLINELSQMNLHDRVSIPFSPQVVHTTVQIGELLKLHNKGIVIKNMWSSSGRGVLFIRDRKTLDQNCNWITAQLKKQGQLIVEPIYTKVQDASLQFIIDHNRNYHFLGINYFDADDRGHFEKEYLHTPDLIKNNLQIDEKWINELASQIITSMKTMDIHQHYIGPVGIDVMFFINENKKLKLYPLVEANLRCNMGLINLSIKKLLSKKTKGHWQISTFKRGEASIFYEQQVHQYPVQLNENGKITKGFLPLTPFTNTTRFAAWGIIEPEL